MKSRPRNRFATLHDAAIKPLLVLLTLAGLVTAAGGAEPEKFSTDISLAEIMQSIVMPAADVLWNAVSVNVTTAGEERVEPQTDEDWLALRWQAVNLATATNLLLVPGLPTKAVGETKDEPGLGELNHTQIAALLKDQRPAWVAHAQVLHEAAMEALHMIDTKNTDGLSEVGGTIDAACESCHLQFWYPEQ